MKVRVSEGEEGLRSSAATTPEGQKAAGEGGSEACGTGRPY